MYNAHIVIMKQFNGEWADWCAIVGNANLEDATEVFVRYGKSYWCYLPNINTLNVDERKKCMAYYRIRESDLFELESDDEQDGMPAAAAAITSKDSSTTVATTKAAIVAKKNNKTKK